MPTPTLHALSALWQREIVKFVRDRSRLVGALAQPVLFWAMLGLGFRTSFALPGSAGEGVDYFEFLFPGIVALMILFTAIFSTISIVEERKSGFLQAALVAPMPRATFVLGSTLGGTTLALLQAGLLLVFVPVLGLHPAPAGLLTLCALAALAGIGFTALGIAIAWRMETTRGFHAVMNLFLLPLWLLSGSFFPIEGASSVVQVLIRINPVSYLVGGIRAGLYWPEVPPSLPVGTPLALGVGIAFAAGAVALATWSVQRPMYGRD
jgi:ABC-2 type transport system permease protein